MTPQALRTARQALQSLQALADPAHASFVERYFKTGPGQYGAGDHFLGIRVPVLRALVREYKQLPLQEVLELLQSPLHEVRLFALLLMVRLYQQGAPDQRQKIYGAYLDLRLHINNWDLVDASAPSIVGRHLFETDSEPFAQLDELAGSAVLWDRRIAIVATQYFIREGSYAPTLRLAERLLRDREDLIHKAVGWMLREVGNRDRAVEEEFLRRHARAMPRTMLRYAIEKLPTDVRAAYLAR